MPSYIKSIARKYLYPTIVNSGLASILANFSKNNFIILNYHGVMDYVDYNISVNHMDVAQFEHQINFLSSHFNLLSEEEFLYNYKHNKFSKKKSVLLTFDDGYENNFKFAFPILKKHNAPATIFLISSLIDSDKPTWYDLVDNSKNLFQVPSNSSKINDLGIELGISNPSDLTFSNFKNKLKSKSISQKEKVLTKYLEIIGFDSLQKTDAKYWKMLSSEQIQTMQHSGLITFGSHTVNHPNLDQIDESDLIMELRDSKIQLEKIVGKPVNSIAFPDGAYNEKVKEFSLNEGYKTLFAVDYRCNSDENDQSIYNRYSISNTTTAESVLTNICLAYHKIGF